MLFIAKVSVKWIWWYSTRLQNFASWIMSLSFDICVYILRKMSHVSGILMQRCNGSCSNWCWYVFNLFLLYILIFSRAIGWLLLLMVATGDSFSSCSSSSSQLLLAISCSFFLKKLPIFGSFASFKTFALIFVFESCFCICACTPLFLDSPFQCGNLASSSSSYCFCHAVWEFWVLTFLNIKSSPLILMKTSFRTIICSPEFIQLYIYV